MSDLEKKFTEGSQLQAAGRYGEAEQMFDDILSEKRDHREAAFKGSELKLMRGAYLEGWPLWEQRVMLPQILEEIVWKIGMGRVGWDGTPMPDGTLLLYLEQGLGDNIMALRYFPQILQRVARVMIFTRHKGIQSLIAQAFPEIIVLPPDADLSALKYDAYFLSMSLPSLFKTTTETIPQPPYIQPQPARMAYWRKRLAGAGPVVGLVWQGNAENNIDSVRSIPLLKFEPVLTIPGIRFVSLQKGDGAKQLAGIHPQFRPLDLSPELNDWQDTTAAAAALDLLVSVDTSVVHIAGALNKDTLMFCRFHPYWIWGLIWDRSPWYPSVRILRPIAPARWDEPMVRAASLVASLRR